MKTNYSSARRGCANVAPLMEPVEERRLMATFTVTTTADSGAGSLRDAITQANKTSAQDTVKFAIGSGAKSIYATKPMPYVTYPIIIDGTTQPGYAGKPIVEVRGDRGTGGFITLAGGNSTVKGLVINRFKGDGILLYKGNRNVVQGNYLGVALDGVTKAANTGKGIIVQSSGNTIGGYTAQERNVVSGSGSVGIQFWTDAASDNIIVGNYIGTDASGAKPISNGTSGISLNGGKRNTIGGTATGARNVISGNLQDGVVMNMGGNYNKVIGNYIGTDATGTKRLTNGMYGIETSTDNNLIDKNVVSGNTYSGIVLWLASAYNNKVTGNFVGTDKTGTLDIGNWWNGIDVSNGSKNNIIGGATAAERNIFSGNDKYGVLVYQGSANTFTNNYVGTDVSGTKRLGNMGDGFRLVQTTTVTITGGIIGYNGGYAVHNGASTLTKISGVKLIEDVLFLVKMS